MLGRKSAAAFNDGHGIGQWCSRHASRDVGGVDTSCANEAHVLSGAGLPHDRLLAAWEAR
jgi:hypothetical protein